METTWKYLINQFLVATRDNYKKALKLSNYHDAALKTVLDSDPANPDFILLYNRYHPIHLEYVEAYNKWKAAGGQQEGQTLNLEQQLELLINKVGRWDAQVQVVFDKKSPEYKSIFPNGRAPFNTGSSVTRVQAVQTLGIVLGTFALPPLVALKADVDAFYLSLDTTLDTQEGSKLITKERSEQLESKRILAMTEQYRNLGYWINLNAENPELIAPLFDLSILRNHRQTLFTGTLDPGENEAVLIHTFVGDDELQFELTGAAAPAGTQVQFYLATTPNGTDSSAVNITANAAKITLQASAFGAIDFGTHRFLTAVNPSATELHYEVELL